MSGSLLSLLRLPSHVPLIAMYSYVRLQKRLVLVLGKHCLPVHVQAISKDAAHFCIVVTVSPPALPLPPSPPCSPSGNQV